MLNYSGIVYRIWGVAGMIILLGLACLLVSGFRRKSFSKECFAAGVLCVLYGCGMAAYYATCLLAPKIDSFQGVFYESYRNSRVAPPLPLTMEYSFAEISSKKKVVYLDLLSKKEILPEGFQEGTEYLVCYETRTNIIVGVEKLAN